MNSPIIMYHANPLGLYVRRVEVEKASDAYVWLKRAKVARIGGGMGYFDTYEEARNWIIMGIAEKLVSCQEQVKHWQNNHKLAIESLPVTMPDDAKLVGYGWNEKPE